MEAFAHSAKTNLIARKALFQMLEADEASRHFQIFWFSPTPMFQTLSDGTFLHVNPAFAEMAGWEEPNELVNEINNKAGTFFIGSEAQRNGRNLEYVFGSEGFDIRSRRKDGTQLCISVTSRPVCNPAGEILYYERTVIDIIQRAKVQQETMISNDCFCRKSRYQSECISQLQQFSDILAHDLLSPLRMISSYLSLIEKRYGVLLNGEIREFFDFALQGCSHMKDLVAVLAEYSSTRITGKQNTPTPAGNALRDAVQSLRCEIDDTKARIIIGNLPEVYADERLLALVFQNLISNAIKYRASETPLVEISYVESDRDFEFLVRDNGRGIPESERERVFFLYQRGTDTSGIEGKGLGLSLCRRVILGYGGKISIMPNLGNGSIVSFTLPKQPQCFVSQAMR